MMPLSESSRAARRWNIFGSMLFLLLPAVIQAEERPNILILLGDDINRSSLGPWGGQAITPHLNQLAADGIRLDNVYANVAMCAPFRQEFFSGRTAWRTQAMPNHSHSITGTRSLPHFLRPLGYRVGLLGKKHIGPYECYPFDNLGELPKNEDGNAQAVTASRTFIRKTARADKPFCLVVASHDGHGPYTTGDRSQYPTEEVKVSLDAIDTPEYRRELQAHLAEVTNLDALLGQLRSLLREEGIERNTLVLFCSEQGNALPFSKWTCFDDGLASGVIVSLPGVIPPGTQCEAMTWLADLAPSLLEAAGGNPQDESFDGVSQWQNWTGDETEMHRYAFGAFSNCNILDNRDRIYPIRAVRDRRYSLIWSPRYADEITSNITLTKALNRLQDGGSGKPKNLADSWVVKWRAEKLERQGALVHRLHHRPEWALYDRLSDPDELVNLVGHPEHQQDFARLKKALKKWLTDFDDSDPVVTEKSFLKTTAH